VRKPNRQFIQLLEPCLTDCKQTGGIDSNRQFRRCDEYRRPVRPAGVEGSRFASHLPLSTSHCFLIDTLAIRNRSISLKMPRLIFSNRYTSEGIAGASSCGQLRTKSKIARLQSEAAATSTKARSVGANRRPRAKHDRRAQSATADAPTEEESGSGVRSVFVVQGVRLVRFAAVVANGRLAPIADLDMIGAEVAEAFGALLVSFVRAAGAGTFHEAMLHGRSAQSPWKSSAHTVFRPRKARRGNADGQRGQMVITILPRKLPEDWRRKASAAWSKGNVFSTIGLMRLTSTA